MSHTVKKSLSTANLVITERYQITNMIDQ
eukprot:SAG11_NODE_37994_length_254_cov_0.819355_1_plen_28_part_01